MLWDSMSRSSKSYKKAPVKDLGRKGRTVFCVIVNSFFLVCVASVTMISCLSLFGTWSVTSEYEEAVTFEVMDPLDAHGYESISLPPNAYWHETEMRLSFHPQRCFQDEAILRKYLGFESETRVLLIGSLVCQAKSPGIGENLYGVDGGYCHKDTPSTGSEIQQFACSKYCFVPRGPEELPLMDPNFELKERLLIQSEHGFGDVEEEEFPSYVNVQNNYTISVGVQSTQRLADDVKMEESGMVKLIMVTVTIYIMRAVTSRMLVMTSIARGVLVRNYRIFLAFDVAGGLLTSPWGAYKIFYFYVMCAPILYVAGSIDPHRQSLFQLACASAGVAATVVLIMRFLVGIVMRKFRLSGTAIYLVAMLSMGAEHVTHASELNLTVMGSATPFFNNARCTLDSWHSNGTVAESMLFDCYQYYQPFKVAGIELMITMFLPNILTALVIVMGLEIILFGLEFLSARRTSLRVTPLSMIGETWLSNSDHEYNASTFETVTMLSLSGRSKFNSVLTGGINTVFGKYYHLGSMIENNLIRWGPLILTPGKYHRALLLSLCIGKKRTVYFFLAMQMYTGVQTGEVTFRAKRENGSQLPDYLRTYNFAEMSRLPDRHCIQ
ncbi:Hypothetical Protein FCC1311_060692 [Hondaea fermentalgiana]|uniref:Uncharacterized protein n=1 Tax=Hondaea fermentalgiana TaxID=2315210 RepID=A0A2R5GHN2_9STRA|nr:Hypothetical Protein FCC1311_060692 [Hondaea fermentalgiana]|eukprot:GBG29849.1 Hypothetical Protein FCC1311_060692 [Hondaea fermentalgiana]